MLEALPREVKGGKALFRPDWRQLAAAWKAVGNKRVLAFICQFKQSKTSKSQRQANKSQFFFTRIP